MKDPAFFVTTNGMGKADESLQQTLFGRYLELMQKSGEMPAVICFCTEDVRLVCEGSSVQKKRHEPESKNLRWIGCSTYSVYFNMKDKVRVCGMGGMPEARTTAVRFITR